MNISFIIILKNRIRMPYTEKGVSGFLELLPNNLRGLCELIKPTDNWEIVVVDFGSTDADVDNFLRTTLTKPNMTYKLLQLNEPFNKGKGLNLAAPLCTHDILFCLDADMIIRTYVLFDHIQKHVVEGGKVLFPICMDFHDSQHKHPWIRRSGLGNVICHKSQFHPYVERTQWGDEDAQNYKHFQEKGLAVKTFYSQLFIHQWHPPVWQQATAPL